MQGREGPGPGSGNTDGKRGQLRKLEELQSAGLGNRGSCGWGKDWVCTTRWMVVPGLRWGSAGVWEISLRCPSTGVQGQLGPGNVWAQHRAVGGQHHGLSIDIWVWVGWPKQGDRQQRPGAGPVPRAQ